MSVTLTDVDLKFLRNGRWNIKVQLLSFFSTIVLGIFGLGY